MPRSTTSQQSIEGDDQPRAAARRNIEMLENEFAIAQEWGLGSAKSNTTEAAKPLEIILAHLQEANAAFEKRDYAKVDLQVLKGRAAFCDAKFRHPIWYLGNTRFGILPIGLTAFNGAIAYWLVFVWLLNLNKSEIIHHAAFFGLAGAVLKSLYWFQFQASRGLLRPRWFSYFAVAPFVGVILGAIAKLVVTAGFKLASTGQTGPDWRTTALIAAFAGFNWEWALDKFKAGAEAAALKLSDKKQTPPGNAAKMTGSAVANSNIGRGKAAQSKDRAGKGPSRRRLAGKNDSH